MLLTAASYLLKKSTDYATIWLCVVETCIFRLDVPASSANGTCGSLSICSALTILVSAFFVCGEYIPHRELPYNLALSGDFRLCDSPDSAGLCGCSEPFSELLDVTLRAVPHFDCRRICNDPVTPSAPCHSSSFLQKAPASAVRASGGTQ